MRHSYLKVYVFPLQLSPIERYAVQFAELQLEPVNAEELLIAEVKTFVLVQLL